MFHVKHRKKGMYMIDPAIIFQRTQAGRNEIHQKSGGLTQSERLVLIMIDGVAPFQAVRSKLPVLDDTRFNRAFQTLQKKELIGEVFLPLENQVADELEKAVIDRFLQQDILDPKTIMLRGENEMLDATDRTLSTSPPSTLPPPRMESIEITPLTQPRVPENQSILHDREAEELERLADEVVKEVRARHSERPRREDHPVPPPSRNRHQSTPPATPSPDFGQGYVHWGYLMIGIGLAFIAGFVAGRLAH
jgi:hypothetical protein